jgi:hypothetical protein
MLTTPAAAIKADLLDVIENHCEACGQAFRPTRSDAKFCSNNCKQTAYRARRVTDSANTSQDGVTAVTALPPQVVSEPNYNSEQVSAGAHFSAPTDTDGDDDSFDWNAARAAGAVIQEKTQPVAAYLNPHGYVVIRQEADWPHDDEDRWIVIAPGSLLPLINRLMELEREIGGAPALGGSP